MGDDSFFRTRMGAKFFDHTMPKIADELARLNKNIEALIGVLGTALARGSVSPPSPATRDPAEKDEPR